MKNKILVVLCIGIFFLSCKKIQQESPASSNAVSQVMKSTAAVITPSLSIGGDTYLGVTNGQWQGNVCGGAGNYYLDYVINTYDNFNPSNYWTITGNSFTIGNSQGSTGSITISSPAITLQIISWSNNIIKVRPIAPYQLDSKKNVTITVKNSANQTCSKTINVIGMLGNGRGFGQCTWEAAYQRSLRGLPIPYPSAYSITKIIDRDYTPQVGDVIDWNSSHTSFILSSPVRSTSYNPTTVSGIFYDSLITYTFLLQERNYTCNEVAGSFTKTFTKRKNKAGTQYIINTGIKSQASTLGNATAYWR